METNLDQPRYAGFTLRAYAKFIDSAIILIPYFLFIRIPLDQTSAIAVILVSGFSDVLYQVLFLGFSGQTLGMKLAKIEVFRSDLSPLRWSNAIRRYLVDILLALIHCFVFVSVLSDADPAVFGRSMADIIHRLTQKDVDFATYNHVSAIVGWVWTFGELAVLLLNEKKRAIHDFIGGTVVVQITEKGKIYPVSQEYTLGRWAKFVTGFLVVTTLFAIVMFVFGQFYSNGWLGNFGKIPLPPELKEAGIRKGTGFVTSNVLFKEDSDVGNISDIAADPANPGQYLVAGKKGLLSIKPTGEIVKDDLFDFGTRVNDLRWVIAGNWVGLIDKGSWIHRTSVLDPSGNTLWTYDPKGVDDSTAVHMGGDAKPNFVVGMNGKDGILLLDENGHLVWHQDEKNVWHVEAADLDGSGQDSIVHSDAAGRLVVRNNKGEELKSYQPSAYPACFTLLPWPSGTERSVAVITDNKKYMIYSLQQGTVLGEWDTDIQTNRPKIRAVWVDWNTGGSSSVAVLADFSPKSASLLTLFDPSGDLQYEEVLDKPCGGLTVVDGATPGSHELWCGCDGNILRYTKAP